VDSSVNNPIEAVAHWRSGKLRALCVFDGNRMPYKTKVTSNMAWNDIPTCKEAGIPMEYTMLRGIFMPSGVSQDVVDFYVEFFRRVRATSEWQEFMERGAFNQTFMAGKQYADWVARAENLHRELMRDAGFLAKK
jgi:tripartite-type tricarboxylate transporter receptor subunit TctC